MAFVDLGDQFLALSAGRRQPADDEAPPRARRRRRRARCARRLEELGIPTAGGRGLDFRDPWGNRVEVVQYDEVQFTKTQGVLQGMGLGDLGKTPEALAELRDKGLA